MELEEYFRTKRLYQSEIEQLTKRGIKWVDDELNIAPGQLKVDEEKIRSEESTQSTTTTSLEESHPVIAAYSNPQRKVKRRKNKDKTRMKRKKQRKKKKRRNETQLQRSD